MRCPREKRGMTFSAGIHGSAVISASRQPFPASNQIRAPGVAKALGKLTSAILWAKRGE